MVRAYKKIIFMWYKRKIPKRIYLIQINICYKYNLNDLVTRAHVWGKDFQIAIEKIRIDL